MQSEVFRLIFIYHQSRDNLDDLALILTLENGKTLAEAKGEVTYAATFIEWFAGEAERIHGEVVPVANLNQRVLTFKVSPFLKTAI